MANSKDMHEEGLMDLGIDVHQLHASYIDIGSYSVNSLLTLERGAGSAANGKAKSRSWSILNSFSGMGVPILGSTRSDAGASGPDQGAEPPTPKRQARATAAEERNGNDDTA
mmetsp:Transcript_23676/g.93395  ORF Transcript_23676/g.93395 Transcript_23676/m.93395 type:complete len:112 (+) Transcript_23676:1291-1626(+)